MNEEGDEELEESADVRSIELPEALAGQRLDKALAAVVTDLSRARLQALISEGRLSREGRPLTDGAVKAVTGVYELVLPPPVSAEPEPQDIPLSVLYEDEHLIVIDKPVGMAVHPAPGTPDHTLVNALLHHCRGQLSGIGGVARPGIVHRLDKDTSGVMVAAKTDKAHAGLSALFSRHDIERVYVAFTRGVLYPARGAIDAPIGRSPFDRKKMAVVRTGGRPAITHYERVRGFGLQGRPVAARLACTLETGRTHQIRVHLASRGAPCLGDQVYGSGAPVAAVREAIESAGLKRQALHAAVLGFRHPVTGEAMRFESPLPEDLRRLEDALASL